MQITIDNIPVTVDPNETLLEAARRLGYDIPSLCYAQGAKHKSSCMVCAVRNSVNGQIMPSCTTLPTEGMQIDTQSEAVKQVRTLSLELLLSDHRADCEAPCALVCPKGLEIEQMLSYYDNGELDKAHAVITSAFALPEVGCEGCKAPCEKACRRGNVDQAVSIRAIVQEILTSASPAGTIAPVDTFIRTTDKKVFQSRLGRFTEREKDFLKATVITPSRCLHCACAGRADCRLRRYATDAAIKRSRYEASSVFPVMHKQQIDDAMRFEQAKCIRCGLCVYNSDNGFTFKDRGFGMQVVIPEENKPNVGQALAKLCPTGAIYLKQLLTVFLITLFISCASGTKSSVSGNMNWKLFRGDAALSGYTDTPLPKEPVLLWTYQGGVRTVSSPIVDNGTTYWCDRRGLVKGVNIHGELSFQYDLQTAVEATPMICDSVLYIGRIDGFMSAISLISRDTLWNYETLGQISASPNKMTFEGRQAVVFGSYDNYLYCVDTQGTLLNKFESGYYLNGAAALWKDYVIFGGCDSWVRIINCKTGIPSDSLLLDAYVPASPAIMGDYCYVGDYSGNIYKLLLEHGKIVRHKKIVAENAENGSFVAVPAISEEAFYSFSGERNLQAISRVDGRLLWKYMLKGNVGESSPVVCKDKILVCTKTGIVSILDAETGRLLWEYDTGEQIIGSPAVIKDHFLILTSKGTLLCFGK